MKFSLDTANLDEIRTGVSWGIADGVTTNPTLIAREGKPFEDHIREICGIVDGDISAEVVETEAGPMVRQGVVKCPLTREGIKATKELSNDGIRVVLAASLRSPTHVIDSAPAGSHIGAMPFKVMEMLFNHPLTDKGLEQYMKDWHKTFQDAPAAR